MQTQQTLFAPAELPAGEVPSLGLRWYQQAARDASHEVFARCRGALVVLPTGTGKSRLAGAIAHDFRARGEKVLVLCPTVTLVFQTYQDMRGLGLRVEIEQASNRAFGIADVIVASVDTLRRSRLKQWKSNTFALVIVDEAHRSTSKKYAAICEHFASAKLLGLTATPDRTDGVSLRNVFDDLAFEMTMLQAIREGWLVPLRFCTIKTNFDPKAIRMAGREVDPASVAKELVRAGLLHEAAGTIAQLGAGERTVAFLPTVAASKAFVTELEARKVPSCHIDGTTPDTLCEDVFRRFVAGEIRVISHVAVLTGDGIARPLRSSPCCREGDLFEQRAAAHGTVRMLLDGRFIATDESALDKYARVEVSGDVEPDILRAIAMHAGYVAWSEVKTFANDNAGSIIESNVVEAVHDAASVVAEHGEESPERFLSDFEDFVASARARVDGVAKPDAIESTQPDLRAQAQAILEGGQYKPFDVLKLITTEIKTSGKVTNDAEDCLVVGYNELFTRCVAGGEDLSSRILLAVLDVEGAENGYPRPNEQGWMSMAMHDVLVQALRMLTTADEQQLRQAAANAVDGYLESLADQDDIDDGLFTPAEAEEAAARFVARLKELAAGGGESAKLSVAAE